MNHNLSDLTSCKHEDIDSMANRNRKHTPTGCIYAVTFQDHIISNKSFMLIFHLPGSDLVLQYLINSGWEALHFFSTCCASPMVEPPSLPIVRASPGPPVKASNSLDRLSPSCHLTDLKTCLRLVVPQSSLEAKQTTRWQQRSLAR